MTSREAADVRPSGPCAPSATLSGLIPRAGDAAPALGLFLAYFAAGKLGLKLAFVHASVTAVWPPTGIALAGLLLLGYRLWPSVLLGAFLVNLTTSGDAAASLAIALGNTAESLLGACLATRFAGGRDAMRSARGVVTFAALAGLVGTSLGASVGAGTLALSRLADPARVGSIWLTWWLGDMGGALILAPFLLLWALPRRERWSADQTPEAVAVVSTTVLLGEIVFGGWVPSQLANAPITFFCFPCLIWAAFRLGPRATATATLLLSAFAVWGTIRGHGPFAMYSPDVGLLLLQAFLGVASVGSLAMAAVVLERERAASDLREAHDILETRVRRRTEDLVEANRAMAVEIRDRKKAEEVLEHKTGELQRSNSDLAFFAYTVSHELQEPLRKITSFGEILKGKSSAIADSGVLELTQRMQDAAHRMRSLVDDILLLSRVTTNTRPLEPVRLEAVLGEVAADFADRLRAVGGRLDIGPLPTVLADAGQMRELFENLVSNALKFRSKDGPPSIAVSSASGAAGFVEVSVRDNGIGFDQQYAERIFKPFQRLHRRTDYEGSGIGLAICSRILLRHGGRIAAVSAPGKGSTFVVTLPGPVV